MIAAIKAALPLRAELEAAGLHLTHGKAKCPFHEDRNPSFSIKGDRWVCFSGCGSGDVIDFTMRLHGLDTRGAIKFLADKAGIKTASAPSERRAAAQAKQEREAKARLVTAFRKWERETAHEMADTLRTHRYMIENRGLFSGAELEVIAELQGKVAELEYFYEGFFCRKDEELKFVLYQQEEINGRKL